jgi:hypothetical protein
LVFVRKRSVADCRIILLLFALNLTAVLSGCGLYTPSKDPLGDSSPRGSPAEGSSQGAYESAIVDHVTCEIGEGLKATEPLKLPWIEKWGTSVTQTITVEDQSGITPGVTFIKPLENAIFHFPTGGAVTSPQSLSFSLGVSGSVNALRTETIQYTFRNTDILKYEKYASCDQQRTGVLIDGDLKIREFILDKATIAAHGPAALQKPGGYDISPFNTFTGEITFVAAYGGTFTPTWKLARVSANTSSNLLIAERTVTNDLVITLGPLLCPDKTKPDKKPPIQKYPELVQIWPSTDACKNKEEREEQPVELSAAAMTQHNARVQAAAIAVSVTGQTH